MDVKALAAKAKQTRDFTKTVAGGGGGYTPPAAGPVNLRFVGYYEIGQQKEVFKGKERYREKVQLVFELSGKNYPASEDGQPMRMTITETLTNNEKGNINKLFKKMNYEGKASHFVELLGNAYRGRIHHVEKERDGEKVVYANLRNEDGYTIGPAVVETVDDDGNVSVKKIKVAEPVSELKAFVWDLASKEMWDAIYIDGEYEEKRDEKGKVVRPAKSKNVIQEKIMAAKNWIGSPMQVILDEGEFDPDEVGPGDEEESDDEPEVEQPKTTTKKKPAAKAEPSKPASKKTTPKKKPEPEPEPEDDDEDDDDPLAEVE